MTRRIFVNLPVADVARATAFYDALGFEWSDAIVEMLPDRAFLATFTTKRIVDARTETGALLSLSRDSRAFEDPDGHGWDPVYVDMAAATEALSQPAGA